MVEYPASGLDAGYAGICQPVRGEVRERLRPRPATVTELAEPFSMSLAAVSKHIRVLEDAGLVGRTVRGREHHLSLEPSSRGLGAGWLETYRTFWEEGLDRLDQKLRRDRP